MHIKIEDLHKSFGKTVVFKGLNLEIPAGQKAVIVGGSGSGKSVLLKHLVGLIKPDKGRVLIDGEDIVPLGERALNPFRQRFGMIFQTGGLLQSLTVGENVALAMTELTHRGKGDVRTTVTEKLGDVGLDGREDQMPGTLSGGQRKRAAIARALAMKTECFLFDEPTAGLDPPMAQTVDEIVLQVNRDIGATAIVVTHDLVSVFAIADVVHMLYEGEIIISATPDEFRASKDERVRHFLAREIPAPSGAGA